MKKIKKIFLFAIIMWSVSIFSSCNTKSEKEPESNMNKCTKYACPIHTDKTSTTMEECPVCNKQMEPVLDSLKVDSLLLKQINK